MNLSTYVSLLQALPLPAQLLVFSGPDRVRDQIANRELERLFPSLDGSTERVFPAEIRADNLPERIAISLRQRTVQHVQLESSARGAVEGDTHLRIVPLDTETALLLYLEYPELSLHTRDVPLDEALREEHQDWILYLDPDSSIRFSSPACEAISGFSKQEWEDGDVTLDRLIHEEDRGAFLSHWQEVVEKGKPDFREFRIRSRSGSVAWIDHLSGPLISPDGELLGMLCRIRDVSERKRSFDLIRLMQFSLESSADAVFWLRRDGSFFYVNDAACRMLGYPRERLMRMNTGDVHPTHSARSWASYWDKLRARTSLRFETEFIDADGSILPVEISANHVSFEGREFNCSFVRDISARKRHEGKLLENRQRLSEALRFGRMGYFEYEVLTDRVALPEETCELLGLPRWIRELKAEEFLSSLLRPAQVDRFRSAVSELLRVHDPDHVVTLELQVSFGVDDIRWINTRIHLKKPDAEQPVIAGVVQDVSDLKQAERDRMEQRQFLEAVLEATPSLVYIYDLAEHRNIWANKDLAEALGYAPEYYQKLGDELVFTLIHPDDIAPMIKALDAFREMKDGEVREMIYRAKHADGSWRYLSSRNVVFRRDAEGRVKQMLGSALDVTRRIEARNALQESELKFRQVAENIHEVFWIREREAHAYLYISPGVRHVWGVTPEQVYDDPLILKRTIHPEYAERIRSRRLKMWNGEMYREEFRILLSTGEERWILEETYPVHDENGRLYRIVGIDSDITERVRFEQQLIEAKEKAEQSDRLKDAFLATVSHEIRTPLNIISGYSTLVQQEFEAVSTEHSAEFFDSIQRGIDRLNRTVDLILSVSRLRSGDVELMPVNVDLCKLIPPLVEDLGAMAAERNISLTVLRDATSLEVVVDEYSIAKVIDNLVDNAIKFTEQGSVQVRLYRDEQGNPAIDVLDTGIGISAEYLPRIFDRYSQEDFGLTRRYEGIGLGLTLVRDYLRMNAAEIDVKSCKGKGTVFTIRFPAGRMSDNADPDTIRLTRAD